MATQGTGLQRDAGDLFVPVTVVFFDFNFGSGQRDLQKLPAECELLCPVSIGEEAVVANTLKSFGQNVEQESTDELLGGECHGLATAVVAIVLPAKRLALDVNTAVLKDNPDFGKALVGIWYDMTKLTTADTPEGKAARTVMGAQLQQDWRKSTIVMPSLSIEQS